MQMQLETGANDCVNSTIKIKSSPLLAYITKKRKQI